MVDVVVYLGRLDDEVRFVFVRGTFCCGFCTYFTWVDLIWTFCLREQFTFEAG